MLFCILDLVIVGRALFWILDSVVASRIIPSIAISFFDLRSCAWVLDRVYLGMEFTSGFWTYIREFDI